MGTSTARRGPSTAVWRMAKGAATRYLSPEGAAPVEAREVVRRYVAALEETQVSHGRDLLAGFRLTRKAAQGLGEFGDAAAASGLSAALAAWDLAEVAQSSPEEAVLALAEAWLEDDGGLEAAVARSALATCLDKLLTPDPGSTSRLDGPALVKAFLSRALYQRLVLDLGECLEAAAPGWPEFKAGLTRLAAEITAAGLAVPGDPPRAGQWQGLAGWVYVTRLLEHLCQGLKRANPER
jgi:hypothetical protein